MYCEPCTTSTKDKVTRRDINPETCPYIEPIIAAKVRRCGDRHLSKAHREERERPLLGVRLWISNSCVPHHVLIQSLKGLACAISQCIRDTGLEVLKHDQALVSFKGSNHRVLEFLATIRAGKRLKDEEM